MDEADVKRIGLELEFISCHVAALTYFSKQTGNKNA